jgi:hypothetical protein
MHSPVDESEEHHGGEFGSFDAQPLASYISSSISDLSLFVSI